MKKLLFVLVGLLIALAPFPAAAQWRGGDRDEVIEHRGGVRDWDRPRDWDRDRWRERREWDRWHHRGWGHDRW